MRRKSAVSGMSHLKYEKRKCAVPGRLHLHHKKNFVQCEKRVYNITTSGSKVGRKGVWCKERNVQYQEGRICSTRRRLCSTKRECTVSEVLHLQ